MISTESSEPDHIGADRLLLSTIDWLQENYESFTFFVERDVVWTVQLKLRELLRGANSDLQVYNDFGILPGKRRRLSTDIAIVDPQGAVLVAAEFKYEPSHSRKDISLGKFPVVSWGSIGVAKDVLRVQEYVQLGVAKRAHSFFIDEGGSFRHRPPHPGSRWIRWSGDVWLLRADA